MNTAKKTDDDINTGSSKLFFDYLRAAPLFSNLSDHEIAFFSQAAQRLNYKKGKILYIEEEPAESFYVIIGGWIKLFHITPEGEEVIVDMLTAGKTVGESAVFEDGYHTCSAQVVEDVQILRFPAALLRDQIRASPSLAYSMLSSMSLHHRRHYSAIALNAMQNAPQRIGCFLLNLCPAAAVKNVTFDLPYDKTLIANTLGMKSATFSRALNILRKKTGIRIQSSRVEIDSVERLTKFVYGAFSIKDAPEHS